MIIAATQSGAKETKASRNVCKSTGRPNNKKGATTTIPARDSPTMKGPPNSNSLNQSEQPKGEVHIKMVKLGTVIDAV